MIGSTKLFITSVSCLRPPLSSVLGTPAAVAFGPARGNWHQKERLGWTARESELCQVGQQYSQWGTINREEARVDRSFRSFFQNCVKKDKLPDKMRETLITFFLCFSNWRINHWFRLALIMHFYWFELIQRLNKTSIISGLWWGLTFSFPSHVK